MKESENDTFKSRSKEAKTAIASAPSGKGFKRYKRVSNANSSTGDDSKPPSVHDEGAEVVKAAIRTMKPKTKVIVKSQNATASALDFTDLSILSQLVGSKSQV